MSLVLALAAITQSGLGALASPAKAGIAPPPAWWSAAVRAETARMVAADLPAAPRRYRFQCRPAYLDRKPRNFVAANCVAIASGTIADPAAFSRAVAKAATQPVATAEDRLRQAAWLRVMTMYLLSNDPLENPRSFVVDETIGRADLPASPPGKTLSNPGDVTYVRLPHAEYSTAALRHGAQGRVMSACDSAGGPMTCLSSDPPVFKSLTDARGDLTPQVRGYSCCSTTPIAQWRWPGSRP